jgi:hypothetical protein
MEGTVNSEKFTSLPKKIVFRRNLKKRGLKIYILILFLVKYPGPLFGFELTTFCMNASNGIDQAVNLTTVKTSGVLRNYHLGTS